MRAFAKTGVYSCVFGDTETSILTLLVRAALTKKERKDYIKAVQCLRRLPSKGPEEWSAARTRYDDFVALHVNLTQTVHGSGLFLTWHRAMVWSYETALRDECGYRGTQPVRKADILDV